MRTPIPTGCRCLDTLLQGGLQPGAVTLLYGEAETGKTTLTLQCTVNSARMNYKVFFIDSDGSFTSQRLTQIASQDYEEISEKILLARPETFNQQAYVINQLEDLLTEKFGLIVIDSVTSLYRAELAEKPKKTFTLNRELNNQLAYLAQIAKTRKIAILATSQVRSAFRQETSIVEPVATRVLKFWADIVLKLKLTPEPCVIKAVLEKRLNQKSPKKCHLRIVETGIEDHDRWRT